MDSLVDEVLAVFPEKSREDVLTDVRFTESVESTINRILDGTFLVGTSRDPSIAAVQEISSRQAFEDADSAAVASASRHRTRGSGHVIDSSHADDASCEFQRSVLSRPPPLHSSHSFVVSDSDSDVIIDMTSTSKSATYPSSIAPHQLLKPLSHTDAVKDDMKSGPSRPSISRSRLHELSSSDGEIEIEIDDIPAPVRRPAILGLCGSSMNIKSSSRLACSSSDESDQLSIKRLTRKGIVSDTHADASAKVKRNAKCHLEESSESDRPDNARAKKKKTLHRSSEDKLRNEASRAEKLALKALQKEEKEKEKLSKKVEKEREKLEKKSAKERERDLKLKAKETEKVEKQRGRSANKLRTKHETITEMITEIDADLVASPGGAAIVAAIQGSGSEVKVLSMPSPMTIKWKRNVIREWDDANEVWRPCEPYIAEEDFVLVRLSAMEYSDMVLDSSKIQGCDDFPRLRKFCVNIEKSFPKLTPILFIEGIRKALQERTKVINDQIRFGVRMMYEMETGQAGGKTKKASKSSGNILASKEVLDSGLVWLQFNTNWFIQLSETQLESEKLIVSFTEGISMIPERQHRDEQAIKLRFAATVKSGTDLADIWKRMLIEIKPCTEPVAEAIAAIYPSYRALYDAYIAVGSVSAQESLLENVMVKRLTGVSRRIGPALSRKIRQSIMSEDDGLAIFDPPPAR